MIVMLGLISSGVAYATWSMTLHISGTVNTGDVNWKFASVVCLDHTPGENDFHCYDNFEGSVFWQGDKDVGITSCSITDDHTVTVTLTNVYPCYFTEVSMYAISTGSTPIIIDNVIIDGNVLRSYTDNVYRLDLNGDGKPDIEIWWGNGFGTQLHQNQRSPEMSFWIHVLQSAPQDATLSFTIEIVAVQYNEYIPPK
jgi:hypothetical protein